MHNEKQIKQYLSEVADVLQQLKVTTPFHIVVTGGAYMLIMQKKRAFTEDIDFASIEIPAVIPPRNRSFQATVKAEEVFKRTSRIPFAKEFKQAASLVAQRHQELVPDWLNDEAASYYYDDAPHPEVRLWQVFGHLLFVYLPTPQYILATKIMAGRQKDIKDIKLLMEELNVTSREQVQAIIDQFLLPEAQEFWEVKDKLDGLFSA
jgi:hypothetical protein